MNIEETELLIYPNPTQGNIFIYVPETYELPIHIMIKNLIGSVIYEGHEIKNGSNHINLNNVPDGHYVLHIMNEKNNIFKKIIKN